MPIRWFNLIRIKQAVAGNFTLKKWMKIWWREVFFKCKWKFLLKMEMKNIETMKFWSTVSRVLDDKYYYYRILVDVDKNVYRRALVKLNENWQIIFGDLINPSSWQLKENNYKPMQGKIIVLCISNENHNESRKQIPIYFVSDHTTRFSTKEKVFRLFFIDRKKNYSKFNRRKDVLSNFRQTKMI